MATLEAQRPLATSFGPEFVCTDQDVADLKAGRPPPETKWCLVELPKEELKVLEAGSRFYFQELSGTAKGNEGGKAALCSESTTYTLEFLENSNSLMIGAISTDGQEEGAPPASGKEAPTADQEGGGATKTDGSGTTAEKEQASVVKIFGTCQVFAQCRGQLMPKPINPDVNKLRELLVKHRLGAPADNAAEGAASAAPAGETIESLQFQVAAAPAQLKKALQDGPYAEHCGRWFLLPPALEREVLDAATTLVAALGWNLEAVDGEALLREVQEHLGAPRGEASVPSVGVLRKALRSVLAEDAPATADAKKDSPPDPSPEAAPCPPGGAAAAAAGAGAGAGQLMRFDKQKVDIAKAMQLLREPPAAVRERFQLPPSGPRAKRARVASGSRSTAAGHQGDALRVAEFVKAFQELTGSDAGEEAVLKLIGNAAYVDEIEGTVSALDAGTLSRDPFERLSQLFALQSHWRPDRLSALVAPTLGAGQKVDPWLLKWTRAVFLQLGEPPSEHRMLTKKFGGL